MNACSVLCCVVLLCSVYIFIVNLSKVSSIRRLSLSLSLSLLRLFVCEYEYEYEYHASRPINITTRHAQNNLRDDT
jgi:hypothetical protein